VGIFFESTNRQLYERDIEDRRRHEKDVLAAHRRAEEKMDAQARVSQAQLKVERGLLNEQRKQTGLHYEMLAQQQQEAEAAAARYEAALSLELQHRWAMWSQTGDGQSFAQWRQAAEPFANAIDELYDTWRNTAIRLAEPLTGPYSQQAEEAIAQDRREWARKTRKIRKAILAVFGAVSLVYVLNMALSGIIGNGATPSAGNLIFIIAVGLAVAFPLVSAVRGKTDARRGFVESIRNWEIGAYEYAVGFNPYGPPSTAVTWLPEVSRSIRGFIQGAYTSYPSAGVPRPPLQILIDRTSATSPILARMASALPPVLDPTNVSAATQSLREL